MTTRKANPKPSPWRAAPMCDTPTARLSHLRYRKRGKKRA